MSPPDLEVEVLATPVGPPSIVAIRSRPWQPGPAGTGTARLTELAPVWFAPDTVEKVRTAADADDRSVSSWIRRAAEHKLKPRPRSRWSTTPA